MSAITSRDLGVRLLEALGLDAKNVTRVQLDLLPGGVAEIVITKLITNENSNSFVETLKKYELHDPETKE